MMEDEEPKQSRPTSKKPRQIENPIGKKECLRVPTSSPIKNSDAESNQLYWMPKSCWPILNPWNLYTYRYTNMALGHSVLISKTAFIYWASVRLVVHMRCDFKTSSPTRVISKISGSSSWLWPIQYRQRTVEEIFIQQHENTRESEEMGTSTNPYIGVSSSSAIALRASWFYKYAQPG